MRVMRVWGVGSGKGWGRRQKPEGSRQKWGWVGSSFGFVNWQTGIGVYTFERCGSGVGARSGRWSCRKVVKKAKG